METFAITGPEWSPVVATVEGRFVAASNATLLGETADGERVIYKPISGIAPLWDFAAETLVTREVWTYRIDRALGFNSVPETVIGDGPYGPGAIQRHVDGTADRAVVDMVNSGDDTLWPIALLDLAVNNADRKAGHLLRDDSSHIWAIDHGLTFHTEDKLRTVLWAFAGRTIPHPLLARLVVLGSKLDAKLGSEFAEALSESELLAMQARIDSVIDQGCHPQPPDDRHALPWPPY